MVCPSILRKGRFTTAAMNSIEKNQTTTTAITYQVFMGQAYACSYSDNEGKTREPIKIRDRTVKKVLELP